MLSEEIEEHLFRRLIPFWVKLRDKEQGGFYGWILPFMWIGPQRRAAS